VRVNQVSWNDLLARPAKIKRKGGGRPRYPGDLTPRQEQAAKLLASGLPLKEIEFEMGLAPGVAKIYLDDAYNRLGFPRNLNRRVLLVRWWIEHREMKGAVIQ
jgi:DNA-binding NarL/FixJ family response regulator